MTGKETKSSIESTESRSETRVLSSSRVNGDANSTDDRLECGTR